MLVAKKNDLQQLKWTSFVSTSLGFAYYMKTQSKICLKGLFKDLKFFKEPFQGSFQNILGQRVLPMGQKRTKKGS